jgi:hypothetical protein
MITLNARPIRCIRPGAERADCGGYAKRLCHERGYLDLAGLMSPPPRR